MGEAIFQFVGTIYIVKIYFLLLLIFIKFILIMFPTEAMFILATLPKKIPFISMRSCCHAALVQREEGYRKNIQCHLAKMNIARFVQ